jgi:hypothetical protein
MKLGNSDETGGKMRETGRDRRVIVRSSVSLGILLAVSGIFALPAGPRIGFGLRHFNQDPDPPSSPPYVSLVPDNLDFGSQVVRRTSAAKRFTVKNTGGQPLYFASVDLGGDNPNSFAVLKDTCTGATIDPDKACMVDVTFTPSATGERNARLRLNDNADDSPQRLKLRGTGINSNDVPPF